MKRLIPVIHILDEAQAIRNAALAHENGCGVFLIHHRKSYRHLFNVAERVHAELPNLWIGTNALDLPIIGAMCETPAWVNAIWVDNSGIRESEGGPNADSAFLPSSLCKQRYPLAEYFGSVALKYQTLIHDLEGCAKLATQYMDTVVTSGEGTGIAADIEKIQRIFTGVKNGEPARLGIASGITPENVGDYLPYVDDFLVATGISKDDYNLDKDKLRELHYRIKFT